MCKSLPARALLWLLASLNAEMDTFLAHFARSLVALLLEILQLTTGQSNFCKSNWHTEGTRRAPLGGGT